MGRALGPRERAHLHVALPLLLGGAAFAWSAFTGPLWLTMVALTLATLGIYAAIGTFWSLPTAILTGTGAAAGLALVNSIGNLGGLAGPSIVGVIKQATGSFTVALLFLAGALLLGAVIALLFGRARRGRTLPQPLAPVAKICDKSRPPTVFSPAQPRLT